MSLTNWISYNTDLIDILFDKPAFNIKGQLKAPPLTENYSTVGTAFNYALRLQVAYLNVNLVSDFPLLAQLGIRDNNKRKRFINDFEMKREDYLRNRLTLNEILPDCIILAKMESVYSSGRDLPNADMFSVGEPDIVDLQILTNMVNQSQWTAIKECYINPGFGKSTLDIKGTDADFIIDGVLIKVDSSTELEFKREYFRQLVGYKILDERENHMYKIESLGIYYSRFGILFTFPSPEMNELRVDGKPVNAREAIEASIREYQSL